MMDKTLDELERLLAEYEAVENKNAGVGAKYPHFDLMDALFEHRAELVRAAREAGALRKIVELAQEWHDAEEASTRLIGASVLQCLEAEDVVDETRTALLSALSDRARAALGGTK